MFKIVIMYSYWGSESGGDGGGDSCGVGVLVGEVMMVVGYLWWW